jgi:deoxyribodipyrimidine photo-lyase
LVTAARHTTIVWLRQDLRLDDHAALRAAARRGGAVLPVFLWSPDEQEPWAPGAASRWWLHQSLLALDAALRKIGSRLILRRGPALDALRELAAATGAGKILWSRRFEPAARARDEGLLRGLRENGIEAELVGGALLFDPAELKTKSDRPYQVFTPFWKACLARPEPAAPLAAPRRLAAPTRWPASLPLESLELEPRIHWAGGLDKAWTPGEHGARNRLRRFAKHLANYDEDRDRPAVEGSSRLSPHLHFGEISPRRVWHEVRRAQARLAASGQHGWKTGPESYLREIGWREFAYHLLHHFPRTPRQPLRERFARFPWRRDRKALAAWQRGGTGFPFVDAGMRELWTTGWMHNRVRMIAGSFLVKDLRISWTEGAQWFWDTLVDADLANNTLGWQWVAGCGADAAPYFRVFNPVAQGERFDPDGAYVRRWVPEIAGLASKWIHKPWLAPAAELAKAGVVLGRTYPRPMVDHAVARRAALAAFRTMRGR